ncbi:DUF1659 domain-containing protein [Desertibacillus haloalkaliphilus]|uniref:DUF1659 domain-containing protein n=1 Tax=Desertibacillus haloalkaliphilus TaxID=1328930 RepID=UPI001C27FC08|nr:DUF1659 domain-containing protein [Desertibacillus haloalkaliphilus]MBU8906506.1 DUF1659 domain-containing protein [Desertibacillus haloalkaliphilus]
MAVIKNSRLSLQFEVGIDDDGLPIYRTKSFNNVKLNATDEQLTNTAQALIGLQQHPAMSIERNNVYSLV